MFEVLKYQSFALAQLLFNKEFGSVGDFLKEFGSLDNTLDSTTTSYFF